jgi:hypothetical protein
MTVFEQEPITNFRRDLAAEDEFRLLARELGRLIVWRVRIQIAWAARRILRARRP